MMATAGRRPSWHWSTSDVEATRALSYWVDKVCNSFLELDIDSPYRRHFRAQLDQRDFGPATLGVVEADIQSIRRTRARIARSRYNSFFLLHLRSGTMRFQQYGRDTFLQAGDCALVDCKEPYRQDCPLPTRCVALRFPEDWLRNWLPAPEHFAARSIAATSGWGTVLSGAMANLDTDMEAELALPDGVVAEQVAALLALATGPTGHVTSGSDKIRGRLIRTLQDRCHEANLTPEVVAANHRISKRYLHHLFAQANTTFGDELMRIRLEHAHRLLSDKRYDAVSITEVAARCGFVAPSHFARRFRRTYGLGPMQFRSARQTSAPHGSRLQQQTRMETT